MCGMCFLQFVQCLEFLKHTENKLENVHLEGKQSRKLEAPGERVVKVKFVMQPRFCEFPLPYLTFLTFIILVIIL